MNTAIADPAVGSPAGSALATVVEWIVWASAVIGAIMVIIWAAKLALTVHHGWELGLPWPHRADKATPAPVPGHHDEAAEIDADTITARATLDHLTLSDDVRAALEEGLR